MLAGLLSRDDRCRDNGEGQDDGPSTRTCRRENRGHAFLTVNSNGMPMKSPVILISLGETTPVYERSSVMPPKSNVTVNEIFAPSTLPFLIGIDPPSKPSVVPVSVVPSALNSYWTGRSPIGVLTVPVHLPSTSAAKAGTARSSSPTTIA